MAAKKATATATATDTIDLNDFRDEIVSSLVGKYLPEVGDDSAEIDSRMRSFQRAARELATWKDQIYDATMAELRASLPDKK